MKRGLLFIVIIVLSVNILSGIDSKILKVGACLSKFGDSSFMESKLSPGLTIGGAVTFQLKPRFMFHTELLFNFKKIQFDDEIQLFIDNDGDGLIDEDHFDLLDNDGDGNVDEDRKDYFCTDGGNSNTFLIELPLLLKYKVFSTSLKEVSIYTGPSIDLLLNGSYDTEDHNGDFSRDIMGFNGLMGIDIMNNKFYMDFRLSGSIFEEKWKFKPDDIGYEDLRETFPKNFSELTMKDRTFSISLSFGLFL